MDDEIQKLFLEAGRACRDVLLEFDLPRSMAKRLVNFLYGCMNQRHTISERIKRRGQGEIDKALVFVARAYSLINQIEAHGKPE
jgi:hypothetical protein